MEKEQVHQNFVFVPKNPLNKKKVKLEDFKQLFDESPVVIDIPVAEAPTIIEYKEHSLSIVFLVNRIEINYTGKDNKLPEYALLALSMMYDYPFKAFGVNFTYDVPIDTSLIELFGMKIAPVDFELENSSFIKLTFRKQNIDYNVDISETDQAKQVHVNVHFEQASSKTILEKELSNIYETALSDVETLLQEVLKNAD